MRSAPILLLLLSAVAFAQTTPEAPKPTSRVEGAVLSISGEPLVQATVRLWFAGNEAPTSFTATTDAQGKYSLDNIPSGRYTLSAGRDDFIGQQYGSRGGTASSVLNLETPTRLSSLDFKLAPQGSIRGRVTDQDGDPVADAALQASRIAYDFRYGGYHLTLVRGLRSNDQGEFVLDQLGPGRYYVSARPPAALNAAFPGYVQTFYPNGVDTSSGVAIELAEGANQQAVDIRLRRERTYHARGRAIVAASGAPAVEETLSLSPKGSTLSDAINPRVRPDGTFDVPDLLPGTYRLQTAFWSEMSAAQEFTIRDADIDGLNLTLVPAAQVSASVQMDGNTAPTLRLAGIESGVGLNGRPQANGTVTFAPLPSGSYILDAVSLPRGSYVKTLRMNGRDALRSPMDVQAGAISMEVVLAAGAGEVRGVVRDREGQPRSGISVGLWPKTPDRSLMGGGARAAATDQAGGYLIENVSPGDYYLLAWEGIQQGAVQSQEFAARFTGRAKSVVVLEGSRITEDPALIPAATAADEMNRIQVSWTPLFFPGPRPEFRDGALPAAAVVRGRITDDRGQPVRKAVVQMTAPANFRGVTSTLTTNEGEFGFAEVPPGTFELSASKSGFLPQKFGASQPRGGRVPAPAAKLQVRQGETLGGLVIALSPQALIGGRILSAAGAPMTQAEVSVFAMGFTNGRRSPVLTGRARTTIDGSYRLAGLPPGQYYVQASSRIAGQVTRLDNNPVDGAAKALDTFYPATQIMSRASTINVRAGEDVRNVDIRMGSSPAYGVGGAIRPPSGVAPPSSGQVALTFSQADVAGLLVTVASGRTQPDGRFDLRGVTPGAYRVHATAFSGSTFLAGDTDVTLADRNLSGVAVQLARPLEITGSAVLEGSPQRPAVTVALTAVSGPGGGPAQFLGDGRLTVPLVTPGAYRLEYSPAASGFYLKAAMLGGQDILRQPVAVSGNAALNLTFSPRVAKTEGAVKTEASGILVSLWPKTAQNGLISGGVRTVSTGQKGRFEIPDLAPGTYYIAAWEDLDTGLAAYPAFVQRFSRSAVEVSVDEAGTVQVEAPLIPLARINEEIDKL